ncbi:BRO-N domain-containing protein [Vagococcus lutrae]|uniref:BRO-N domain-containing protein n=1 Tax=Vagococcus lutrae TaxID=81947 RepID=UPI0028905F5C|nr:Bro-N domain-containing protein [Vagococcus lutrae]MDT2842649.1 Bro-N domain-containing protein [Vagococcus lutrae]
MNLQIIDQREVLGKDFKFYGDYDNPLFLAKDVASWIEHTDQRKMIQSVDEDEKLKGTLFLSGQKRQSWFLTEDGLYEVLMQSRKPIAKKFKKEVKKILKDVRKHGMYAKDELLDNPELMLDVVSKLIEEKNKRIELEQEKKLLESTIAEYEPKVNYLDIILESEDTVTVS